MTEAERAIAAALIHLAAARDLLKVAQAPRATAKVRAAITSTQGAQRHASHAAVREAEGRPMTRHQADANMRQIFDNGANTHRFPR